MAAKILVVDDDQTVLTLIKSALQRSGYESLLAIDGHLGLKFFEEEKVDLAIIDIAMPGMDGYEVIEAIRKEKPDFPIIILTAHNLDVMVNYADELGVDVYVTKPFRVETLIGHVRTLLGKE
jgi:two-component system alkaline phosphatase synthesis response regulator PhoP